jgi:hypothetical protein
MERGIFAGCQLDRLDFGGSGGGGKAYSQRGGQGGDQ